MTAFTIANMPLIALIPKASVKTADTAKTGARRSARHAEDGDVLTRRCRAHVADEVEPQSDETRPVALLVRLTLLRVKRLLHGTPVVGAKIDREGTQRQAEQPRAGSSRSLGRAHACLGRGTSRFARAISTMDSSRSISAVTTRRPSGVSR
jgi:hypothetical protein